jgi:hypothetical protein
MYCKIEKKHIDELIAWLNQPVYGFANVTPTDLYVAISKLRTAEIIKEEDDKSRPV